MVHMTAMIRGDSTRIHLLVYGHCQSSHLLLGSSPVPYKCEDCKLKIDRYEQLLLSDSCLMAIAHDLSVITSKYPILHQPGANKGEGVKGDVFLVRNTQSMGSPVVTSK
jgi:hypothetical protein